MTTRVDESISLRGIGVWENTITVVRLITECPLTAESASVRDMMDGYTT